MSNISKPGTCASTGRNHICPRDAVKGHIMCLPCRLAAGGYNRYNRRWECHPRG